MRMEHISASLTRMVSLHSFTEKMVLITLDHGLKLDVPMTNLPHGINKASMRKECTLVNALFKSVNGGLEMWMEDMPAYLIKMAKQRTFGRWTALFTLVLEERPETHLGSATVTKAEII